MCVAGLRPLCAAFPVNYHIDNGSCHSAFRPRRLAQSVCAAGFFIVNSRVNGLVEILLNPSLRGPCMILYRPLP